MAQQPIVIGAADQVEEILYLLHLQKYKLTLMNFTQMMQEMLIR
jgi:hypothetical protein